MSKVNITELCQTWILKMGNCAIKDDQGEIDYRDLWRSCASYQQRLKNRGYKRLDRVCLIFSWDNREDICFLWACILYGLSVHIVPHRKGNISLSDVQSVWDPKAYFVTPPFADKVKKQVSKDQIFLIQPIMNIDDDQPAEDLVFSPSAECVVLETSGTSGEGVRLVALSFDNLFYSARGINQSIFLADSSVWYLGLPVYHISGLSILSRCFFSFCTVYASSKVYHKAVLEPFLTHFSFVQAQVAVLLEQDRFRGKRAKSIVIGGGYFSSSLLKEMRRRRWPVIYGYGMTETSSQVAVARLSQEPYPMYYEVLPYRQIRIGSDQEIQVKGETNCTGFYDRNGFHKVSSKEFLKTQDRGVLTSQGQLIYLGRSDDIFKSYGVKIIPSDIEEKILQYESIFWTKVFPMSDSVAEKIACGVIVLSDYNKNIDEEINEIQSWSDVQRVHHLYLIGEDDYLPDKWKASDLEKLVSQWKILY